MRWPSLPDRGRDESTLFALLPEQPGKLAPPCSLEEKVVAGILWSGLHWPSDLIDFQWRLP